MVEQLGLSSDDVFLITELIDSLILEIVPNWKPSFESFAGVSNLNKESCTLQNGKLSRSFGGEHQSNSIPCHGLIEPYSFSEFIFVEEHDDEGSVEKSSKQDDNSLRSFDFSIVEWSKGSKKYAADFYDSSISESVTSESTKKSGLSYVGSSSPISNDMCLGFSSESLDDKDTEKDQCNELKLELNTIAVQYEQCCHELLRMRAEAMENTKKRWTTRKRMPVS